MRWPIGSHRRGRHARLGRNYRLHGSCGRRRKDALGLDLRHPDCRASRNLGPGRCRRPVVDLEAVGDNLNRRRGTRRHRRASPRLRNRGDHRHTRDRNSAEAVHSNGVDCNSAGPSNSAAMSNTPQSRKRSDHKDDRCHTRIRCCSRCYRQAACRCPIRNSLRNILQETTSSKR